jgi:hypothetical protein
MSQPKFKPRISKIQGKSAWTVGVKFLRSMKGKTRRDRIKKNILTEEIGVKNLLTELEENQLCLAM